MIKLNKLLLVFVFVSVTWSANPIVNTMYTADPAALVYNDSLFIFTGHDEQGVESSNSEWFLMKDWHVFVTDDMENYHDYGAVLTPQIFEWASGNAFAGHCEFRNNKFYWYVAVTHKNIKEDEGFAIGVAVADHPSGPWKDAIGSALVDDYTPNDIALNIDPAIFIDNGVVWLYWGSWNEARRVKLKNNMIELDGGVEVVNASGFFEAPWIHKYRNNYYFSYASGFPSTTNYSMSKSLNGPWEDKGVLNPLLNNSNTNHQAIVKYLGHWYFIYHGANRDGGWTYRRSVNVDYLYYNEDAEIIEIKRTATGVDRVNNSLLKEGVYRLRMTHSELVIEEDSEGVIVQQQQSDSESQLWNLIPSMSNPRYYSLVNLGTMNTYCPNNEALLDTLKTSSSNCEIRIENASIDKGYYLYSNYDNDFVADVLNVSIEVGMPLITWLRTGADNQKIKFEFVQENLPVNILAKKNEPGLQIYFNSLAKRIEFKVVVEWKIYDLFGRVMLLGKSEAAYISSLKKGYYIVDAHGLKKTILIY